MEYFRDHLAFMKRPLGTRPMASYVVNEGEPLRRETMFEEQVDMIYDPEYMIGLIDEVHKQITALKRLGLTPVSVCMSHKTYEQMFIYNYNLNGSFNQPLMFGLTPVVSVQFQNYQVEVLCSPKDEWMYKKELSKLRYEKEGER